jgi:tagatose 1,6-diphosphate aldolase
MFKFINPGKLVDGDLELVLDSVDDANSSLGLVPQYRFRMQRVGTNENLGGINLRIGNIPVIVLYAGHIGYGVGSEYRGHHYAARSCKLLMPLAKHHQLNPLWITCNPDNYASRRTCELAGGRLIEIVDVPEDNDMYLAGERQKCRYRFDL